MHEAVVVALLTRYILLCMYGLHSLDWADCAEHLTYAYTHKLYTPIYRDFKSILIYISLKHI